MLAEAVLASEHMEDVHHLQSVSQLVESTSSSIIPYFDCQILMPDYSEHGREESELAHEEAPGTSRAPGA